ncbi:hypothetical protein HDU85_005126 [Gaertneriomyces sp. JEL0708]|nr:hypothetical protein HDU85_005126 [Gaertneriomyces sp. JEL0708]
MMLTPHLTSIQYLRPTAVVAGGIFTGAAIYISAVDVPAMATRSATQNREEFKAFYPRAAVMQASMSVVASLSSGLLAYLSNSSLFLAPCAIFAVIPAYTIGCMLPVNKRLMDGKILMEEVVAKKELHKWSHLHLVRSILSAVGFVILAIA